jgi:hypothetical protein
MWEREEPYKEEGNAHQVLPTVLVLAHPVSAGAPQARLVICLVFIFVLA